MPTVWFETHATTVDNEAGLATGHRPGAVSARGERQAVDLGARLRGRGVGRVLTSDLARAVRTVELALADGADVAVVVDAGLRECDFGSLTGGSVRDLHGSAAFVERSHPDGESWRGAVERNAAAVRRLLARADADEVVAVVGHRATWMALEVMAGRPLVSAVTEPRPWRPGWRYLLDLPGPAG